METSRKFTLDELSKFDGKEGRPAYVAYNGKVMMLQIRIFGLTVTTWENMMLPEI